MTIREKSEKDKLIEEKIELAKKLGIWDVDAPVENFRETPEFKRIQEINVKLAILVTD